MTTSIFLSILVPVYNWDVRALLEILHNQAEELPERYGIEIIAVDDGSDKKYDIRPFIAQLPLINYEKRESNEGRVAIRNHLISRAKGEFILLLDGDMLPDHETFLLNYIELAESGCDIISGGISYKQHTERKENYSFYYYKSAKTEAISAKLRRRNPWRYVFTSNIVVRRTITESVPFDPRFTGYGFEDIEWALRLADSYGITHIDNCCSHMGVMSKRQTFSRMRDSIDNFALLLSLHPQKTGSSQAAKVSRILTILPDNFLQVLDQLLVKLFFAVSWNPMAFIIFQCDKMILLAKKRKE